MSRSVGSVLNLAGCCLLLVAAAIAQTSPVTLTVAGDSYLKGGAPNQNQGTESILRIQANGNNRTLVQVDQTAIATAVGSESLASAVLRLYVDFNADNWSTDGRPVNVHRMNVPWTELGATWLCPDDTDPSNSSPDCNPQWEMGSGPWPFEIAPTDTILHANGQTGWVEWDVTADVQSFLDETQGNYGWVVRKSDESVAGHVDYSSREGSFPPELVLTLGEPPPPPPLMLTSIADTFVKNGSPNQNQGNEVFLRLQSSGKNRALVLFDQDAIETTVGARTLLSAKLKLTITSNSNNWGPSGRDVNLHRMTLAWTEQGATWNCPDDTNPANSSPDCNPDWNMTSAAEFPFENTPTTSYTQQNGQTGVVELDVTADVTAFLDGSATNFGWLIKKDNEGQSGKVEYSSREGEAEPELVLEVQGGPTDTTPPTISAVIDPLPNSAGWNNTPVAVSFDCQDAESGIAFCSESVTISAQGTSSLFGVATDVAGNNNQVTVTVNLDAVQPQLAATVAPPPNLAGWNNTDATVTFVANDGISGISSVTPPLGVTTEGAAQAFPGTATDLAGNVASVTATVNLDKTAPVLEVTMPASDTTVLDPALTIEGTVTDPLSGLASVTCDETEATFSGDAFTCEVVLAAGENSIDVEAIDVAGNTSSETLTITYDAGPALTILQPADFTVVGAGPITVSGTVGIENAVVTVAGVAATVTGTSFSASVPLRTGANTITAVAQSPAGASGLAAVHVTLDDAPPLVTIDSPAENNSVHSATINVSGTVRDPVGGSAPGSEPTVSVNGVPAQVSGDRYEASGVALVAGLNTLTVTATDALGNTASRSIQITFQDLTGLPRIEIVSGDGQTAEVGTALPNPLVARLVDALGNPVANTSMAFRVARDTGTLSDGGDPARSLMVMTDAQGQAQVTWTLGGRAGPGQNIVEAMAAGFEGEARFSAEGTPGGVFHVHANAGNNQTGLAGQPLPMPLDVVVTDANHNRVADIPVTFTVLEGEGTFAGQPSVIVNSDLQGRAVATLTLGPQAGITNNVATVTAPGNVNTVRFSASAETSGDPAATLISGVVLDNTDVPIEGVTVHVEGAANPPVVTDAEGQFVIASAPVGALKLSVDGTTTTRAGEWPHLEYDIVTIPGNNNTVGQPIYLLPIDVPNGLAVSETMGGALTMPSVPGFALTVEPGAATFPGGSKSGVISVTVVHADKVPMTPNFGQQPRLIITIQPAGVIFDPPAKITYPNLDGLAPGSITELYSFDHDLGQFVGIGTGSVTDDGLLVESDPGVGVVKGGWHCEGNPAPTGDCEPVRVLVTSFSPLIIEQGSTETASALGLPSPGQYEWTTSDETAAALLDTQSPVVSVQGGAGLADLTVRFTNDDSGAEATGTVQAISGTIAFQTQVIDQDDPENQQFEPVGEEEPIYGGSIPETSDDLQLMIDISPPELRDRVTKFEWSVEGDGSEEYVPPDAGPDQDSWEVGDIRPNPGTLEFQVSITFEGGTVVNKSREFDVGIRTDDVAAIGYIDPIGVDLDPTDVGSDVLKYFPLFGFGPLDPAQKLKTAAYLGLFVAILGVESTEQLGGVIRPTVLEAALAVLSTTVLIEILTDIETVQDLTELLEDNGVTNLLFLNEAERGYILNWQFKHAANPVPRQPPDGGFVSYDELDDFRVNNKTSYKLFNRFQVKYLVDDSGTFAGAPTFITADVAIGDTPNPIIFTVAFPNPEAGQQGPRNGDVVLNDASDLIMQINDGTPVQIAVDGFNGVAHPRRWSHIGSRVVLGIANPLNTSGITVPQVYPTYHQYSNLTPTNTFDQAPEPIDNFSPAGVLPYPPNESLAPFIP